MADDAHTSMMKEAETEGTGRRETLKKTINKVAFWAIAVLLVLRFLYLVGGPDEPSVAKTTNPPTAASVVIAPLTDGSVVVLRNEKTTIVRENPNTNKECPGVPKAPLLGTTFEEVNRYGCFNHWKVESGRVILSNGFIEKEVGPEGANLLGWTFYKARAKEGSARFRYINCVGEKQDMSKIDCS